MIRILDGICFVLVDFSKYYLKGLNVKKIFVVLIACLIFAIIFTSCKSATGSNQVYPETQQELTATSVQIIQITVTPSSNIQKVTPEIQDIIPETQTAEVENIPSGIIAFYSDRDGNPEIYTMLSDGSQETRLTNDPAFDDSPAISPDGSKIVFLSSRNDPKPSFPDLAYDIYVMNIDGTNLKRLTATDFCRRSSYLVPG